MLHDFFQDIYQKPFLMKEVRKYSWAFLIHVGHKNCKKKKRVISFFQVGMNWAILQTFQMPRMQLFAMVYRMLNVLHFMFDI